MDRIFDFRTVKGIKSALTSMSGELDETYRDALKRIQKQAGDDGELGMRILGWITHAKRPLSVNELRYGLAVEYSDIPEEMEEFDEENLLSPGSLVDVCAGLVIIDANSQVVRLVHYTTQEYIDKARLDLFEGCEVDMSRACLTYLSQRSSIDIDHRSIKFELFPSYPFMDYACHYWFFHVRNCLLSERPDSSFVKAVAYFKSSDSINFSVHLLCRLRIDWKSRYRWFGYKTETYPYEVASYLDFEDLMAVLLDPRVGPYPNLDSSLFLASSQDHLDMARLLLQNGAARDVTLQYGLNRTLSALEVACQEGNLAMAESLVEHGADIHCRSTARNPPIHAAARGARSNIIDILLSKGVNVNARDSSGRTACHMAAGRGYIRLTRRLIDAGCDLELRDDDGNTVLLTCARYSTHVETFELLLDRGADACAKNKEGKTVRNIIEELPGYYNGEHQAHAERVVEILRHAEQKSTTTTTNNLQETESSSLEPAISRASTLYESHLS